MRRARSTGPLRVEYAQGSPATSGAAPALDGDGLSLPHGLSVAWCFDQRDANNGPPSLSDLPQCSDALAVLAGSR